MNFIVANKVNVPPEIQKEVDAFSAKNCLYGSRYMAQFWGFEGKADKSDWDFSVPYTSEYDEYSKANNLGWEIKERMKYLDELSVGVYEKIIVVNGIPNKVQVCSKIDYRLFNKTFQSIEPSFYWTFIHKSGSRYIEKDIQTAFFNQLYKTARS